MKSKRQETLALAVALVGLLALAWLAGDGGASVYANGTTQEKILVSISNDDVWTDDTLYTLNPDGSGQTRLFDFHNHPKHTSGRILQPRVAPDGSAIYFSSDNAYAYTPASSNLFRIASDGSWWDQITPDSNSGLWNQPGPYGTVEGKVTYGDGTPWGNCPVYLEGMDMTYSQADGSFRFENVPQGERFVIAYKPGDTPFDAQAISVVANSTYTVRNLVPYSNYRTSYQYPALYGSRIYHRLGPNSIWWTDVNASAYTNAYTVTLDLCTGVPGVDGFNVAPTTGKLAILDYQEGCGVGSTEHQGLYTTDKDGNNRQLLVDMISSANFCDTALPQNIFWSPDESRIAFTWCYNWNTSLLVYDSANGTLLGGVSWTGTSYTVNLHGWSPDGNWLLYSSYLSDPAYTTLAKIPVNADGSLNTGGIVNLLTNTRLSGATWDTLRPGYKIYLPTILRNYP